MNARATMVASVTFTGRWRGSVWTSYGGRRANRVHAAAGSASASRIRFARAPYPMDESHTGRVPPIQVRRLAEIGSDDGRFPLRLTRYSGSPMLANETTSG